MPTNSYTLFIKYFHYRDKATFINLYRAYIRPVLKYGSTVSSSASSGDSYYAGIISSIVGPYVQESGGILRY